MQKIGKKYILIISLLILLIIIGSIIYSVKKRKPVKKTIDYIDYQKLIKSLSAPPNAQQIPISKELIKSLSAPLIAQPFQISKKLLKSLSP